MEIKPMGNTEQEKMSSLWGYFIACCKILDDVTIEYQEPCVSDYYLNHISAMQSKTILSGMEKFHTLANERVVKMPSKLYPQGKAVLDVMTAIVAASGKYPIAKTRIADLHEFELLARATISTCWREGNMLKVVRNLEGISLQKLAEKSGVSKNTIFRIENNQSIPRIDVLRKLADALEAPLELVAIGIGKTEPETTPEEEVPNPNAPKLPSVYDSQDRGADDEIKAFQK